MKLQFSGHALQRMFARGISPGDVRQVIDEGEIIAEYPNDRPFPSALKLGFVNGRAIHTVVGYDVASDTGHVITAYLPDPNLWHDDMKTRKRV